MKFLADLVRSYSYKKLRTFLHSGLGLVVVGFVFASSSGALINHLVHQRSWENETQFEIFKLSLQEATRLQEELISLSTKRYFYMGMIYGRLKSDTTSSEEDIQYWLDKLTPVKDTWNQSLTVFFSKLRVLFDERIAYMLMIAEENTFKDYEYTPNHVDHTTSLQQSFEDAHKTLYYLLFVCNKQLSCENWNKMVELAKIQLDEINTANNRLSNAIVKRLLDTPYGLSVD